MSEDPFDSVAEVFDWIQTFKGDIPFWINQARRNEGPVLELGCGTGRTTWEIANAGVPVVGIDNSTAMLRIAESKRKFYPKASSVILKKADMRDLNMGVKFNTILMPGRSFEHILTPEEHIQTFLACNNHLQKNGNLVVFVMGPPPRNMIDGKEQFQKTVINPDTGNNCRLYIKNIFDWENQITTHIQRFEELETNGNILREWHFKPMKHRWWTAKQLEKLGTDTNFKVVARFSDWLRRPYQDGDACLVYVYQKN